MTNYKMCVMRLRPGVNIGKNGPATDYNSISLRDTAEEMPTQAECDAIWPTIEVEILAQEAQEVRRDAARIALLGENIKTLRDLNAQSTTIAQLRAINDKTLKIMGYLARMLGIDITINGG